ncbi:MAG: tetratricopeptide repeat protein [Eubacteriales bacterium]
MGVITFKDLQDMSRAFFESQKSRATMQGRQLSRIENEQADESENEEILRGEDKPVQEGTPPSAGDLTPPEITREEPASGAGGESWKNLFDEAVKLHDLGIEGDKEAVKKAYNLLKKVRAMAPQNILVEAYYGCANALLGRDAIDPMERFKKAMKGLKILDGAVAKEPDNKEIRILRGFVCLRLPEMYFHRTATAVEDFSYLVSLYDNNPGVFAQEFYWQLLFNLGEAKKNLGQDEEAEAVWKKLLTKSPGNKYRQLLRQEGMQVPELTGVQNELTNVKKKGEMFLEGIHFHNLALQGDKDSTLKALNNFAKAAEENPDDLLLQAYHVDCLSMSGRDAAEPAEMFANAIKAMKSFDKIVNASPDNVDIRFLRAYQSFRLPEAFFRRTTAAIADFEYLIQRYESDHTIFSADSYWQLLHDLGAAYQRMGMEEETSAAWDKLLASNPGSKYEALITKQRDLNLSGITFKQLSLRDRKNYYDEGFRIHDLAVAGNRAASKAALDLWQKAHEADPADALAMAYYASSMALVARDSTDPSKLFGDAIKGLVLLNKAASRDSNNPKIRLLRGYLTYSLPESFFHLTGKAIKDFRFLKSAYERDNSVFSEELYHKILHDLGEAYQRTGDSENAKKTWNRLLKGSGESRYKELLSGRL